MWGGGGGVDCVFDEGCFFFWDSVIVGNECFSGKYGFILLNQGMGLYLCGIGWVLCVLGWVMRRLYLGVLNFGDLGGVCLDKFLILDEV